MYPVLRAVTNGPKHHYFGYYDKFPWDATGRYLVGLETYFMHRPPAGDDYAIIGRIDLWEGNRWEPMAKTNAWNWQQGTMLHWLPTAPDQKIIYNDREGDHFISVIRDLETGEAHILPLPVYALSRDGRSAVSLNFARVARTRPGYGYAGAPDPWADDPHPVEDGIYWMDLETGEHRLIISLAQIVEIRHDSTMDEGEHWFNHLQFCTDNSRFLFLHRWKKPDGGRYTRLFTANPDGSDIYCVSDHDMVSHFDWKNATQILAWARRHGLGDRYFLFTDRTDQIEVVGESTLSCDGHCSYSPDRRWILTDTYPDAERMRTLILYRPEDDYRVNIGRFFAPKKLDGEIRCDLHPRWSRDGTQVCFDSVHEGTRQIYVVDVEDIVRCA